MTDIDKICDSLRISLNKTKTRIYKLKEAFTHLWFRFILLDSGKIIMKTPKSKKQRIKRYLLKQDKEILNSKLIYYKNYLLKRNNYIYFNKLKKDIN